MGSRQSTACKMKLLLVVLLASAASAQLISSIKKTYNDIRSKWGKCPSFTNDTTCAYLFDEDGCEGWQLAAKPGYTEMETGILKILSFTSDKPKANDAEAVVVRNGCIFIAAVDGNKYVDFNDDEYDFEDKISSMDCVCK